MEDNICPACSGEGIFRVTDPDDFGPDVLCEKCNGTGKNPLHEIADDNSVK